jgi:hypothetical protein
MMFFFKNVELETEDKEKDRIAEEQLAAVGQSRETLENPPTKTNIR